MTTTPIHNLTDVWADVATTFNAIKMNVTDTASADASKLFLLQVGGTDVFAIDKSGAFPDSLFAVVDNADRTKKVQLQVSGITTGNTRVLTVPDYDGTIATLAGTETLTNKTIDSANNTLTLDLSEGTLTGTLAEFNTALSDGSFASLAGSETLTNKTLTSPVLNGTLSGDAFLDEDNMASNSATKLASQQSVKAYFDNQMVANYTALKALAAGLYSSVWVEDASRGGMFVWRTGDQSTQVTNDPGEGVWVPPSSDASGASGAWQRLTDGWVTVEFFGGTGSGDETTTIQRAFAWASANDHELRLKDKVFTGMAVAVSASVNVRGTGQGGGFKLKDSATDHLLKITGTGLQVLFDGVYFDGNEANQTNSGANGYDIINSTADGDTDADFYTLTVENCTFENPHEGAIRFSGDNSSGTREILIVRNNRFKNGSEGVDVDNFNPGDIMVNDAAEISVYQNEFDSDSAPTTGRSAFILQHTNATVTVTGASQANPVVITAASHGFANGDEVWLEGLGGMTEVNNRAFTVASVTASTFALSGEDGTGHTAYTSGGTAAVAYETSGHFSNNRIRRRGCNITQGLGVLDLYIWAGNFTVRDNNIFGSNYVPIKWKSSARNLLISGNKIEETDSGLSSMAGNAPGSGTKPEGRVIISQNQIVPAASADCIQVTGERDTNTISQVLHIVDNQIQGSSGVGTDMIDVQGFKTVMIARNTVVGGTSAVSCAGPDGTNSKNDGHHVIIDNVCRDQSGSAIESFSNDSSFIIDVRGNHIIDCAGSYAVDLASDSVTYDAIIVKNNLFAGCVSGVQIGTATNIWVNDNIFESLSGSVDINLNGSVAYSEVCRNHFTGSGIPIYLNGSSITFTDIVCRDNVVEGNPGELIFNQGEAVTDLRVGGNKFYSGTAKMVTFSGGSITNVFDEGTNDWNFGSAAPSSGDWYVGQRVYDTGVSAGGTIGWVCTTAGAPGTWKTFGAVAA